MEVDFLLSVMSHFDQTDTSELVEEHVAEYPGRQSAAPHKRPVQAAAECVGNFFHSKLESETGSSQRWTLIASFP